MAGKVGDPVLFPPEVGSPCRCPLVPLVRRSSPCSPRRPPRAAPVASAETVVAVSSSLVRPQAVVSFDSATPTDRTPRVFIRGLQSGESIVGIDHRPATGDIVALSSRSRLFTLDAATGIAHLLPAPNPPIVLGSDPDAGTDFNPVPDRLRTTTSPEGNFRTNVDTGEYTVDGTLAYAAGDRQAGRDPDVVASGYTNSFAGATATQLFDIDARSNFLVLQDPPNSGGLKSIGALGVDTNKRETAFDISGETGTAYAVLSGDRGDSAFYRVHLTTGAATRVGTIGGGRALHGHDRRAPARSDRPARQ